MNQERMVRLLGLSAALALLGPSTAQCQCRLGERVKLTAPDGASLDHFGRSLALDGDVALVGASESDSNGPDAGAATYPTFIFSSCHFWNMCWAVIIILPLPIQPSHCCTLNIFGASVIILFS